MAADELLSQAVAFLTDPSIQSSPLHKKTQFLETKGLSSEQIQEALRRADSLQTKSDLSKGNMKGMEKTLSASSSSSTAPTLTPAPTSFPLPPLPSRAVMLYPPKQAYTWRHAVMAATLLGGLCYSLYYGFKKYAQPYFKSKTSQEASELDSELEKLRNALASMRQFDLNLVQENEQLKASLASLSEDLKKKEDELKARLEELLDRVAFLLNETKESQSAHTNEWRAELTSLRTLFLAKYDLKYSTKPVTLDTIKITSIQSEENEAEKEREKENKEMDGENVTTTAPPLLSKSIPAWQLSPLDQSNLMTDDFE